VESETENQKIEKEIAMNKPKVLELVLRIIVYLIAQVSMNKLDRFADLLLDFIENTVQKSDTKIDDRILLPLCELIRETFKIADND